jgi:hypothetical protein
MPSQADSWGCTQPSVPCVSQLPFSCTAWFLCGNPVVLWVHALLAGVLAQSMHGLPRCLVPGWDVWLFNSHNPSMHPEHNRVTTPCMSQWRSSYKTGV